MHDLDGQLADVLRTFPEIRAAFLFGSRAEGRGRPDSDIDLALVPASPALRDRKLDILAALAGAGFDNVDLVILDTDDVVLRFQAVSPNRLVFAAQGFDRGTYFSRAVREYFDLLPILEVQRAAYKRRLLHG